MSRPSYPKVSSYTETSYTETSSRRRAAPGPVSAGSPAPLFYGPLWSPWVTQGLGIECVHRPIRSFRADRSSCPATPPAVPHFIAIDAGEALTRVWFEGRVTGREIIEATDELVARPDFDAGYDQFWSLEAVGTLDISPEEMSALITHDRELVETGGMGRVRVAIVITTELREFAIQLYRYQMRSSGQNVQLFWTEEDAEAWLTGGRVE